MTDPQPERPIGLTTVLFAPFASLARPHEAIAQTAPGRIAHFCNQARRRRLAPRTGARASWHAVQHGCGAPEPDRRGSAFGIDHDVFPLGHKSGALLHITVVNAMVLRSRVLSDRLILSVTKVVPVIVRDGEKYW